MKAEVRGNLALALIIQKYFEQQFLGKINFK